MRKSTSRRGKHRQTRKSTASINNERKAVYDMKYNFDEVIDRSHNRAAKYDERMKKFGREDVIPLWVAGQLSPS